MQGNTAAPQYDTFNTALPEYMLQVFVSSERNIEQYINTIIL